MTNAKPKTPRRGFTLVELLVVLVIIAMLAALAVSVVGGVINNARVVKTSAVLSKVNGRINDRIQTLSGLDYEKYELLAANLGINDPEQRKVAARKIAFREAFPQTWEEFDSLFPNLSSEITDKYGSNVFTPATESAEVLYYILTEGPLPGKGRRKVISGVRQLDADEFDADVADTDQDGLLEFVDGWGNPIRFYRWPTRLIRPTGPGSLSLDAANILIPSLTATNAVIDPDDPYDVMSVSTNIANQFEQLYHTPGTYHVPLLVSAGPDEILGMFEPSDSDQFGHLAEIANGYDGQPGVAQVDDNGDSTIDDDGEKFWPGSDDLEPVFDNISNLNSSAIGK